MKSYQYCSKNSLIDTIYQNEYHYFENCLGNGDADNVRRKREFNETVEEEQFISTAKTIALKKGVKEGQYRI